MKFLVWAFLAGLILPLAKVHADDGCFFINPGYIVSVDTQSLGGSAHPSVVAGAVNDSSYWSVYYATYPTAVTQEHMYCNICGNQGYQITLYSSTSSTRLFNLSTFHAADNSQRWFDDAIGSTWNLTADTSYYMAVTSDDGNWQPGQTGDGGSIFRSTGTYASPAQARLNPSTATFNTGGRITVILNNTVTSPN